ncbi:hypothetical protein [Hyalangium sp.]|uniref:hypothetical protein n=1 Tax=Hyalangium sp. TaxID=2028555 RepID=UPI002D29A245|nr:hypothetical protein [Hyalangium sp.]HYI01482.1 hypothetical protein [Hyalangium sp.]
MRNLWPALLCLLAACGGNFSNEDLEYLNALPSREALASKLPGTDTSSGSGLAQRRDRLVVGDISQLYIDTRKASADFNASLDSLLGLLENIRTVPPTTREPDRRTWGPWPDRNQPGHQVRFLMDRAGDSFDYRLQFKPSAAGEEAWWSFLEGSFKADAGIRVGEGELHLFIDDAVAQGLNVGGLRGLKQLDVGYQNKALPTRVEMIFSAQPTPPLTTATQVRYNYRELPGGLGEMRFLLTDTDAVPGNLREDVEITSRWTPNSGGVATFVILQGDLLGASYRECWDAQNKVTFAKRSWELFGIGKGSDCPDLSGFDG